MAKPGKSSGHLYSARYLAASAAIALLLAAGAAGAQSPGETGAAGPSPGTTSGQAGGTTPGGPQAQTPATGRGTAAPIPSNMRAEQFNTFVRGRWDANSDGFVSDAEWNAAVPAWFGAGSTRQRTFAAWDRNSDQRLDTSELNDVFSGSSLHEVFDTNGDGVIDRMEAARIPR